MSEWDFNRNYVPIIDCIAKYLQEQKCKEKFIQDCIEKQDSDKKAWANFVSVSSKNYSFNIINLLWENFNDKKQFEILINNAENYTDENFQTLFNDFLKKNYNDPSYEFEFYLSSKVTTKFSIAIANANNKVDCAKFLLNNIDLFKNCVIDDDTLILMMYEIANEYDVNKLQEEILGKISNYWNINDSSPRLKIVFYYLYASYYKHVEKNEIKMQNAINKANSLFLENFKLDPYHPEIFPNFNRINQNPK